MIERGNEWTIYFRDGSLVPPAVQPGHNRRDQVGWERMEVVRADTHMIDAAALHRAADRIDREAPGPLMNALAAAGAQFIHETDMWATEPGRPNEMITFDPQAVGYGIMLGYLAAAEGTE